MIVRPSPAQRLKLQVLSGNSGTSERKPHFCAVTKFRGAFGSDCRLGKVQGQQPAIKGASCAGEACVFGLVRVKGKKLTGGGYGLPGWSYGLARMNRNQVRTTIGCGDGAIFGCTRGAEAEGRGKVLLIDCHGEALDSSLVTRLTP